MNTKTISFIWNLFGFLINIAALSCTISDFLNSKPLTIIDYLVLPFCSIGAYLSANNIKKLTK